MNDNIELVGKVDLSIYGVRIPADLIHSDGITTTAKEKTIEIPTMNGTVKKGTGIFDEATIKWTMILPNMDFLKNVLPDLYQASSQPTDPRGRIAIGGNTCSARSNTSIVVHYSCQENSDNDVYAPNANVVAEIELGQNSSDPVKIELTANAEGSAEHDGVKLFLGTGDLTEKTLWNPATEAYEAV